MAERNSIKSEMSPEEECPGRPAKPATQPSKHARKGRKQNWETIAKTYIYGEKDIDAPATAMPSFPTLEQLATRFKLPLGTVKSFAHEHRWTKRRAEARQKIVDRVHEAMLKQAAECYIPLRAGVGILCMNVLQKLSTAFKTDTLKDARDIQIALDTMLKLLTTMDAALGITDRPEFPIPHTPGLIWHTQGAKQDVNPPRSPTSSQPVLTPPESSKIASMWSIQSARDARIIRSPGVNQSPEELSHLSPDASVSCPDTNRSRSAASDS